MYNIIYVHVYTYPTANKKTKTIKRDAAAGGTKRKQPMYTH